MSEQARIEKARDKAHDGARRGDTVPSQIARTVEPVLGSVSDVRLHTGPDSAALASSLGARAFTVDRDIHFAHGAFRPDTGAGRDLISHELVHAAQPIAAGARGVASAEHPAEREAESVLRRAPQEPRAGLHRFLPSAPESGLRKGEVVPMPEVLVKDGDRFRIATEVDAQRVFTFVITVHGELPVSGPGVANRVLRIPVIELAGSVHCTLVERVDNSLAYDLYGDGHDIIRIGDLATVGSLARSREHTFIVNHNGELAKWKGEAIRKKIDVELPTPTGNATSAGDGTPERAVMTTFSGYGDVFQIIARRFGNTGWVAATIISGLVAEPQGDHPTVFVRMQLPPERLSAKILRNTGRTIELDLDGDGHGDVTYDHSASDKENVAGPTGDLFRERTHVFVAIDARGMRLGDAPNHHVQRHTMTEPLPAIPASGAPPAGLDPGVVQTPEDEMPMEPDRLGALPHTVFLPGGVQELRVDADGDRRRELLVRIRPPQMCLVASQQDYTIELTQISSGTVVTVPMVLDELQAKNLNVHVARLADGTTPLAIDIVRDQIVVASAPPTPVTLEIAPPAPLPATDQIVYVLQLLGSQSPANQTAVFPPEVVQGGQLVKSASQQKLAGLWTIDAVLGEFGDTFRFTITRVDGRELLGVAGVSVDGSPGEARPVRLVKGTTSDDMTPQVVLPAVLVPPPYIATSSPQQLEIRIGERSVIISDAIGVDPGMHTEANTDPLVARTHRISLVGDALVEPRELRFDYHRGSFRPQLEGLDMGVMKTDTGTPEAGGYRDRIVRSARAIGKISIHAAIDLGYIRADEFAEFQDSLQTVFALLRFWSFPEFADALPVTRQRMLFALTGWSSRTMADVAKLLEASHDGFAADAYAQGFENYAQAIDLYDRQLFALNIGHNVAQEDTAAATAATQRIEPLLKEGSELAPLIARFDAAIAGEIKSAHETGIVNDAMYDAWNDLRLARPKLLLTQQREAGDPVCMPDTAIGTATTAARTLQAELGAATDSASGVLRSDYTHEQYWPGPGLVAIYTGGDGEAFADALLSRRWDDVWTAYQALDNAIDRWVTNRLEAQDTTGTGPAHDALVHNQYVHQMRAALGELPADTIAVAASFVPDAEYANQAGYATAYPIRLFVWHDGAQWQLRDLTNPEHKFETSAQGTRDQGPPHALFQGLNDKDRFPHGVLFYQVPGGHGDRVQCTADKKWYEWVREGAMIAAGVGLIFATFGTGTVAVAGGVILALGSGANAVAAAGQLIDNAEHGTATTGSVLLNIFDIIASLAAAGSIAAGTTVSTAAEAERVGQAWTGARAEIAAFADKAYVPLAGTALGANVGMAAVMTVETLKELTELGGLPEPQRSEARQALLIQLAIVGGLTALSVKGELPELMEGKRNIVLDVLKFPNGEEIAVARYTGVRFRGKDVDLALKDPRQHALARWSASEAEAGHIPGIEDPAHEEAFRAWLAQPRRVDVTADGMAVRIPRGPNGELPPPEVREWLGKVVGPNTELGRAERAFAIADQLARGAPLAIDPLSATWAKTRPQVVKRLGGGPQAEAIVAQYERARLGDLSKSSTFRAQRAHLTKLVSEDDLDRLRQLFSGYEVYVTGAALDPATDLAKLDRIQIVVAVPGTVSADEMAAIEQRAMVARIHPDPELARAPGASSELGVDVKVVPTNTVVGVVGAGAALHRIDNVLLTRQVQLTAELGEQLKRVGMDASKLPKYEVRVLSEDDFKSQFASERGRSVVRLEDDRAVIYARPNATRLDMLDEAAHLAQAADPLLEHDLRLLSGRNFDGWKGSSASDRMAMFQAKLNLEIDAKRRVLAALHAGDEEIEAVQAQLDQLLGIQRKVGAYSPDQISRMNAGTLPMPEELETPPWLFSKTPAEEAEAAAKVVAPVGPEARTLVTNSPATDRGATVHQLGNTWEEKTIVTSRIDGKVVSRVEVDGGTIVTVRREADNVERTYTIDGPAPKLKEGDTVTNGQKLGETDRTYRRIEVLENGTTRVSEEIQMPDGTWRQRGSISSLRGKNLEEAAQKLADKLIADRIKAGELSGAFRLKVQRGGGGFDDVIVEFSVEGGKTTARVRIREVKDYPNRTVPIGEFTAIRGPEGGDGLAENLKILRRQVAQADQALSANLPRTGEFAKMSDAEIRALTAAMREDSGQVVVEVVTGPTTKIADPQHAGSNVMSRLQDEVKAELGPGSFRGPNASESAQLEPYVADVERAKGLRP